MTIRPLVLIAALVTVACEKTPQEDQQNVAISEYRGAEASNGAAASENKPTKGQLIPPAPGEVGGLPDDRALIVEGPIDPKSAQGAAQVLQQWSAAMEQRDFSSAWALSSGGSYAHQQGEAAYAKFWSKYAQMHVLIGRPGEMEGSAGSSFVEIPVQIYGRMADGTPFNLRGPVVMRRVNDVPGATDEQLQWRIESTDLKPMGVVKET